MENKEPNINFCGPESTVETGRTEPVMEDLADLSPGGAEFSAHAGSPESRQIDLGEVKQRVMQAGDRMKERVKDSARTALDTRKENAAETLTDVAHALHRAADQLHEGHRDAIGEYADKAAQRVERFCSTLRDKDMESLVHDAEDLARSKPGFFLGGAVTLGFLAARFIKSSSPSSSPRADWASQPRESLYPDIHRSSVPVESSTPTAYTGGEAI